MAKPWQFGFWFCFELRRRGAMSEALDPRREGNAEEKNAGSPTEILHAIRLLVRDTKDLTDPPVESQSESIWPQFQRSPVE